MFQGRAQQLLTIGDDHFRKQHFDDAYQRYKDAAVAAPDLAEVYFRQGLALSALGRWEMAARALRRGLQFDSAWPRSTFRLDRLYGDNALAKTAHWETLAQAATERPHDTDLMFLLGVQLYFDGQRDRARAFFQQVQMMEPGATYVQPFLEELAKPAAAPAGPRQI
jgi:tetratricopeptide (TPR) repeat protein